MYWYTSDEHLGHANIIRYCNRPFSSVEEMDNEIIKRHNEVVSENDTVIHAGDFTLIAKPKIVYRKYIDKLNGKHIFLRGSHDYWLKGSRNHEIMELTFDNTYITICHYAMRVWPRSHYNSILLFGHSHGRLSSEGKSMDIGVDTNNFYPYSFEQIKEIMKNKPDNSNLIRKDRHESNKN